MIEIHEFADLSDKQKDRFAHLISLSTIIDSEKERPLLVQVSMEEILATNDARIALASKDVFAGYIRAKTPLFNEEGTAFRQVGTLTVMPEFRGNGVGRELVSAMTRAIVKETIPFAFVNPISEKTFDSAGYRQAQPGELPPEAVSLLGNQPMIHHPSLITRSQTAESE